MGLRLSFFTFVYLSFTLFSLHLSSSRQPLCRDDERNALLMFKESVFIDKSASDDPSAFTRTELWNSEENSDCCLWGGVKCDEDNGYVTELDFSSSRLYGSINSTNTIFNLVHLRWLSLADNHFNGSQIPPRIKILSKLAHLNLSMSVFSGHIPPEILELSELKSLDLSRNSLSGIIPPSLGNLLNLVHLDLSYNIFQGIIPHSLGNLENLIHLDLSSNNFQGTISSSLGNLTNLVHLDLSNNNFQGEDQHPAFVF